MKSRVPMLVQILSAIENTVLLKRRKMPLQAVWLRYNFGMDGDLDMNWLRKFKPYYTRNV